MQDRVTGHITGHLPESPIWVSLILYNHHSSHDL